MKFANWTIDQLFARCVDLDNGSLTMDAAEFAALRRLIAEKANSPVIPDGWKLVPVELTEDMVAKAWREALGKCDNETIKRMFAAMLAAAPTPTK